METRLFIVTPVYNDIRNTLTLLRTLLPIMPPLAKLVVVDNGSTDGTGSVLCSEYPEVTVLNGNRKLLWTGAINIGIRYALKEGADCVLFLNNDAILHPQFLEELLIAAEEYPEAIISSKILSADEPWRVWSMGGKVEWIKGKHWLLGHNTANDERWNEPIEVDWLAGMVMLVPTKVFRQGIWLDERAFPHYSSDSDFCMRAKKAGFKSVVWPKSYVYNKEKSSGLVEKVLLGVEPFSLRLFLQILTSNKSSAAFCTFGRLVVRHAPMWTWPQVFIRFYGFLLLKLIQTWLRIPGPHRWINKKRFAASTQNQVISEASEKEVADNFV